MYKQKGFTLIELIIVIVVLGILAVTAAPRFFDFTKAARISSLNGLKSTMVSAANMINARAAIEGKLYSILDDDVYIDGVYLVFGYPTATPEGILKALELQKSISLIDNDDWVYHHDPGVIYITHASFKKEGTAIQAIDCYAFYVAAESLGGSPRIGAHTNQC